MNPPSCSLGSLLTIHDVISCAKLLSNTDVNTIWVPETWGMENFAMHGAISQIATLPRIGSSIINVYSRTPAAIAMGAATIDTISNKRFILGLGASSRAIISGLHGIAYRSPLRRVQETVEIIRLVLSGKEINYNGNIFKLQGFKLLIQPARENIPIYLAAVNQKMTRLAWSIGDGVIFYLRPIHEMRSTILNMNTIFDRRIDVASQIITCVSNDDYDSAMYRARRTISFYVAVGKVYRDFISENGFAVETKNIHDEFARTGLHNIHKHVTDQMVDAFAIVGDSKSCRKKLDTFMDAGVTHPILQFNPVGDNVANSFDIFVKTFFR